MSIILGDPLGGPVSAPALRWVGVSRYVPSVDALQQGRPPLPGHTDRLAHAEALTMGRNRGVRTVDAGLDREPYAGCVYRSGNLVGQTDDPKELHAYGQPVQDI